VRPTSAETSGAGAPGLIQNVPLPVGLGAMQAAVSRTIFHRPFTWLKSRMSIPPEIFPHFTQIDANDERRKI